MWKIYLQGHILSTIGNALKTLRCGMNSKCRNIVDNKHLIIGRTIYRKITIYPTTFQASKW
jgi:hypothetical protein